MATFIMGKGLLKTLCEVAGIEYDQCNRIILDVSVDNAVTVYTTTYADKAIEDLDWKVGLTKIEPE